VEQNQNDAFSDEPKPTPPQPVPVYMPPPASPAPPPAAVLPRVFRSLLVSLLVLSVIFNIYIAIILVARMQEPARMSETEYIPGDAETKIALIDLTGVINMQSAEDFRVALQQAAQDDTVKGVILVINSPGGQVAPSAMMNQDIQDFLAQQEEHAQEHDADDDNHKCAPKKIYSAIQQVGASGAYWAAVATQKIYAQQNAAVGSIGVIYVSLVIEEGLKEKLGIQPVVIKSSRSPYKDKGSPFRMPTKAEIAEIQSDLDAIHERFVTTVMAGRKITEEDAWAMASGNVFDGPEAIQSNLIDQVGFLNNAIEDLAKELDIEDPMVVRYAKHKHLLGQLTGATTDLKIPNIKQQIEQFATTPRIQALWLGQ
jgi:protease-4